MSLQGANADVHHVNDVMIVCEGSAGLIALAVERQIVVMPLAIIFVVGQVLKKSVGVGIGISFAHAFFHRVGPGGDVGESFARLQDQTRFCLRRFLS